MPAVYRADDVRAAVPLFDGGGWIALPKLDVQAATDLAGFGTRTPVKTSRVGAGRGATWLAASRLLES